jgi:L-fuculose-phosphate aldolase
MPTSTRRSPELLRRELTQVCHRLYDRDLVGASEGNVSCRLGEARFLLTPSGVSKGMLRAADLLIVNGRGEKLQGRGRPSTEIRMHLAVYAGRPDVGAIVHAHPITATALTVAGLPPPNDLVPDAAVTLGRIAVAAFATPGTDEVPASLAGLLPGHDVILLERHGALAFGKSLTEAFDRMETLERVARIAFLARLLGSCDPLSAEVIEKVLLAAGRAPRGIPPGA